MRDSALFRDDLDRVRFIAELARISAATPWICIGFCLMRTHYHLLLDVNDGVMPIGMKSLNFRYAMAFNSRHGTRGHVIERRYYAGRIETDSHLLTAFRYVMRNPVSANLCETPQAWRWSSFAAAVGVREEPSFVQPQRVLALFDDRSEIAITRMRAFVDES